MGIKDKASKGLDEVRKEAKVIKGDASKDKVYKTERQFDDEDSASFEFFRSKKRLFNVNNWSKIPGIANANFELFDERGESLTRDHVETGDFIKIDLPGPLPFYWVRVSEVRDEDKLAEFVVQPSYDPTDPGDKTVTDHFFRDKARSIFQVTLEGNVIVAKEIGLNEAINNQDAEAGNKSLVNTIVSEGGWAGFQKYQWENLTDYIVGLRLPRE